MSDTLVWEQFKSGNQSAFRQIYGDHVDALIRYGSRFTKDGTIVEDAIHDLFVYLWQNRLGLSATDSIRRYLLVATRRRIIKKLQQQNKFSDTPPEEMPFEAEVSIESTLIAKEWSAERKAKMEQAFDQLSKRQREALFLKYQHNMDYDELCEAMDLNYQSARNLVSGAIRKIRQFLDFWWLLFFLNLF
ncbi:MAG: sigma-70 family RNA polymerase sigma factor [Bacteroidota bacterium]